MQGLYALRKYVMAEQQRRHLVSVYESDREFIYCSHYPQYDSFNDMMVTASVENAVIYLEESEERYKRDMESVKEDCRLLQDCLKILSSKELDVFNHVVWGDPLPKVANIEQINERVTEKLCSYIEINHLGGADHEKIIS